MRKSLVLMTALAAFCAAPATFAADSACKLTGGWLGYLGGYASWVAVADGVSNTSGTITIDFPALDPALFGLRPAGVKVGIPVWLGKLSGTETLGPDCSVEKITATFYAYEPWQDPYKDEPFAVLPQPDHDGYRMKVDLPAK